MGSLLSKIDGEKISNRIDALDESSQARWGKMTIGKVVPHMSDQLRVALGKKETTPQKGSFILKFFLTRALIIHYLPFPKGKIETVPEMLSTDATELEKDKEDLKNLIREFPEIVDKNYQQSHPVFGVLSGKDWAVLSFRHLEHHLSQFGV